MKYPLPLGRIFFQILVALCMALGVTSLPACSASKSAAVAPVPAEKSAPYPAYASVRNLADTATADDSASSLSFNVPIPTLTDDEGEHHLKGDTAFSRKFNVEGGLGPAFNANACIACHTLDGRGALPAIPVGETKVRLGTGESILLRISYETERGSEIVPGFTEQLFHRGVYELRPDSPGTGQADIDMTYATANFTYPDGSVAELRTPKFILSNAYDAVGGKKSALEHPDLRISPRIGPPMIGLGLLEAIEEKDILALADPDDKDGDGISGRANMIDGKVGRFGWKANNVSVRTQVAAAFSNDMGIRSSIFPKESIWNTPLLDALIARLADLWKPLDVELPDATLDALEFYTSTVAVPPRRDIGNTVVMNGARQFETIGCTSCHTPHFKTAESHISPALSHLDIYPFSDGLLHDMGDELADGRRDHGADGREWKTRPLWGIGLTKTVNSKAGFLHDGRARSLEEAVLFHGGEANGSRQRFASLPLKERLEVIAFLRSL